MRIQCRAGAFETNSSSMHSIVVKTEDEYVTKDELFNKWPERLYFNKDNELVMYDVEESFEREPFNILTTFREKLNYAFCSYLGNLYADTKQYDETYQWLLSVVKEVLPVVEDFDFMRRDELDILRDKDGNMLAHDEVYYDYDDGEYGWYYTDKDGNRCRAAVDDEEYYEVPMIGGIDHQSSGLLQEFLENRGISLKEFLTNKRYIVVIDGDEYQVFEKFITSGILDRDKIETRFPKKNAFYEEEI